MKSSDPSVTKDDDDFYYLKSAAFDTLPDALAVGKAATNLLPRINGMLSVYQPGAEPVDVNSILWADENGQVFQSPPGPIIGLAGASAFVEATLIDGSGQQIAPLPSPAAGWLAAAQHDSDVQRALSFFVAPHNWFNLYKVFEIIRDDVGNKVSLVAKGWAARDDIERFTDAANAPGISGADARHGSTRVQSWNPHLAPMSLDEAESLVRTLLTEWLQTK